MLLDPNGTLQSIDKAGAWPTFTDPNVQTVFRYTASERAAGRPITPESLILGCGLTPEAQTALLTAGESVRLSDVGAHVRAIREAAARAKAIQWLEREDCGAGFALAEVRALLEPLADATGYPRIVTASAFTANPFPRPAEVIEGVILKGGKLVYGGPSKAFKTWVLLDLCFAVADGGEWLGLPTARGRALYVNFELQPYSTHFRLGAIAQARGVAVPENLSVWNLRGQPCALDRLLPELLKQIRGEDYSLIVIDPIYKALQGRDENGAGDIGAVCNEIEALAVKTGAAVAFGAHFAKGNAAGKNAIDRIGGSGVFARDPDAILTATPHAEEGCFTLEMTLRDFAQPEPFAIRWQFPQMVKDQTLNPADLKQAKVGREPENTVADILRHLGSEPTEGAAWKKACVEDGISTRTFFRLRKRARDTKQVTQNGDLWTARKGRFND